MRVVNDQLSFDTRIPDEWEAYSFKVNFRNQIIKVDVSKEKTSFKLEGTEPINILVKGKAIEVQPNNSVEV